jgi:hypothetical protein
MSRLQLSYIPYSDKRCDNYQNYRSYGHYPSSAFYITYDASEMHSVSFLTWNRLTWDSVDRASACLDNSNNTRPVR